MAKKIKHHTPKSQEELEAEKKAAEEEAAREQAGIQDEFQAKGFELVEWAQEHRNLILAGIGAVVLTGAGIGVTRLVQGNADAAASSAYSMALETWQGEVGPDLPGLGDASKPRFDTAKAKAEAARGKFLEVVSQHGDTGAGALAHLYAGHASMDLGEWEAAATHYADFLEKSDTDDGLRFAALSGRAVALESKGDVEGAIADHQRVLELSGAAAKDASLLGLARLFLAKGDTAKARTYVEQLEKQFPESPLSASLDGMKARLGVDGTKDAG
ncbi:MAG: tetratricopeptide repeat protein [Myxococcota bacterium]